MGILFVLLSWGLFGLVLAVAGALIARKVTGSLIPPGKDASKEPARKRAMHYATILPFACLIWAMAIFMLQGFINTTFFHRDIGLGDLFYCPLPNGYSILMIDVGDRGIVYNPKTQTVKGRVTHQEDVVSGVRRLQVAGPEILGKYDTRYAESLGQSNAPLNRYFLLDTRTGNRTDFPTRSALRAAALNRGIRLKLEPIFSVYRRYRVTWFDILAVCLLVIPLVIVIAVFIRLIARLSYRPNPQGPSGSQPARA